MAQGDLLSTVGGQVEDEHGEAGDEQAGMMRLMVEQGQALDEEVVGDAGVDPAQQLYFLVL